MPFVIYPPNRDGRVILNTAGARLNDRLASIWTQKGQKSVLRFMLGADRHHTECLQLDIEHSSSRTIEILEERITNNFPVTTITQTPIYLAKHALSVPGRMLLYAPLSLEIIIDGTSYINGEVFEENPGVHIEFENHTV